VPTLPASEIERVLRGEYGRAVAVLVRIFGDIDGAAAARCFFSSVLDAVGA